MEYVIFFISIIAVVIVAKMLSWPLKKILKLLVNTAVGLLLVLVINTFGIGIGIHIPFNIITAIVVGVLGIPGTIVFVILNYIF